MKRMAMLLGVMLTALIVGGFVYADPSGVYNSPTTPDTTGFNYYYIPQLQTQNGMIDYSDPQLLFKIVLQNTLTEPNLLVDSSGNLFDTYNFADLGAVETDISGVTHYVLTINTTANTTSQPYGVTESKSGVYHYGSITLPDGRVVKFWVVDTTTAGNYNAVFVDINADKIIDFSNLGVGSYFTITDSLGGEMQIVIYDIDSNGNSTKIYNAYDNLVSGMNSPIDGTPLAPVMKPHWVTVGINTATIANVKSVDFLVMEADGTFREVKPSDFYLGSYNATTKAINIVVLLGDYKYNGVYIPAEREVYALAHLEPVTYDVTKTYNAETNETILTITLHNNAGMSLGAGYITIKNVAPADALDWIQKTLTVVSGGATASVESGLDGVNLVLKFNSLQQGDTQVVVSYKYVTPLVDIQKTVEENNQMLNDLKNITENNVIQMLNQLIQNSQEVLTKLQNGTNVDLTPIQSQLDTLSQNVQNNGKAIGQLSDSVNNINSQLQSIQQQLASISAQIQNLQTTVNNMNAFDVKSMIANLKAEINNAVTLLNNLNAQLGSAGAGVPAGNESAGGAGAEMGSDQYTAQIQSQLTILMQELQKINADVSKFNEKTSPFIVMMYYNKVLLIENEINNLLWDYNNYVLQTTLSGKLDQINGKLGSVTSMITNMQNSVATSVNKIPSVVSNSIDQKVAPIQNDLKNIKMFVLIVIVVELAIIFVAYKNSKKEEEAPEMPAGGMPGQPGMGGEMGGFGGMGGEMAGFGGQQNFGGQQGGNFGGFGMPEQ